MKSHLPRRLRLFLAVCAGIGLLGLWLWPPPLRRRTEVAPGEADTIARASSAPPSAEPEGDPERRAKPPAPSFLEIEPGFWVRKDLIHKVAAASEEMKLARERFLSLSNRIRDLVGTLGIVLERGPLDETLIRACHTLGENVPEQAKRLRDLVRELFEEDIFSSHPIYVRHYVRPSILVSLLDEMEGSDNEFLKLRWGRYIRNLYSLCEENYMEAEGEEPAKLAVKTAFYPLLLRRCESWLDRDDSLSIRAALILRKNLDSTIPEYHDVVRRLSFRMIDLVSAPDTDPELRAEAGEFLRGYMTDEIRDLLRAEIGKTGSDQSSIDLIASLPMELHARDVTAFADGIARNAGKERASALIGMLASRLTRTIPRKGPDFEMGSALRQIDASLLAFPQLFRVEDAGAYAAQRLRPNSGADESVKSSMLRLLEELQKEASTPREKYGIAFQVCDVNNRLAVPFLENVVRLDDAGASATCRNQLLRLAEREGVPEADLAYSRILARSEGIVLSEGLRLMEVLHSPSAQRTPAILEALRRLASADPPTEFGARAALLVRRAEGLR